MPLRVAVWGLGRHATNNILPAVAATPVTRLYGVCSRNADRVRASCRAWNCRGWTDSSEMLSDLDVDVVYVATPIGLHATHGREVLRARKHLWCEKPLTGEVRSTLELLEMSRREHLAVCEGQMYLHHPQFGQLSGYIAEGRIGRALSISSCFGIPTLDSPGFRTDPQLGGGALLDVGCYPVSAIDALFPDVPREVKYATISKREGSLVDTDGAAVLAFANGMTAHLEWRINCAYRNEISVWGDRGSVFTGRIFSKPADYVPTFRICNSMGVETEETVGSGNHFVMMLQHFSECVRTESESEAERRSIARRADIMAHISRCAQ